MATVNLKKIVKRYGKVETVHGIDLDIRDNEFLVLVGPSGCGKSTTLRMIAGLEEITDGNIEIDGSVVNDLAPKDRNIAMVFQNYALYPHMTVRDNMAFSLKMRKTPKAEIENQVNDSAGILGLESLLKRKPAELSGGQRQRVAMGRAIVRHPKVFLFDEPLSNLDAKLRIQMRTEIKRMHARLKNTVVYVTHDQVEAMTLADRIVVMRDGYIEQIGTPIEIFNDPANVFVAGFIGNPPMNLVPGEIAKNGDRLILKVGEHALPVPPKENASLQEGQKVIMGLRPEDMAAAPDEKSSNITKIRTKVDVAEPLGAETLLHLNFGGKDVVGKSEGRKVIQNGTELDLFLDLDHLHVFDAATEKSVY